MITTAMIYAEGDELLPIGVRHTTPDGLDLMISIGGQASGFRDAVTFDYVYAQISSAADACLLRLVREGPGEARVLAHDLIVVLKSGETDPLMGQCVVLTVEDEP